VIGLTGVLGVMAFEQTHPFPVSQETYGIAFYATEPKAWALTLTVALTHREMLSYSPYPQLTLPTFNPLVGLALLGLLVPAVVTVAQEDRLATAQEPQGSEKKEENPRTARDDSV
jgi:hypothetical protein